MSDYYDTDNEYYESDDMDYDDALVEVDECVCSECGRSFDLPPGLEVDKCPNCNIPFDKGGRR